MADLLVTVSTDFSRRKKKLRVNDTITGNYVQGGTTLDLTKITNPKLISNGKCAANPTRGAVLNHPGGYNIELTVGATLQTWSYKILASGGAELAAGAIPAAITNDPVQLEFEGPLGAF